MNFIKKLLTRQTLRKVPEITIFFWIIKLLTTAMGESTSDFLVHHIDPVFAVIVGFIAFSLTILLQFWIRRYIPWVYWLAATMVAVFGTIAADVVHIVLGISYLFSSFFFALALGAIFYVWYRVEHTLSIHSILATRREIFYWLTIVTTFALGTAVGDMTAVTFNLGYLDSGILFTVLFALPLIAYAFSHANEVLTFWIAYILTRPLGASFADWFGRAPGTGGIGVGAGKTSLILSCLIVFFVVVITRTRADIKRER